METPSNLVLYQGEVRMLSINTGITHVFKSGPREVHITRSAIVVYGQLLARDTYGALKNPWELTIPLDSIYHIQLGSYYAEGCVHYDEMMVGIDASINGTTWNYGIRTPGRETLFRTIQRQKAVST